MVRLRDSGATDGVPEAAFERCLWHAVVARVLMCDGGDGKCAEELTCKRPGETDTGTLSKAFQAGAVLIMRIGSDGYC